MSDNDNEYNQYTSSGHEYVKVDGILKKIEVYEKEEEQNRKQSLISGECGDHKTPEGSRGAKRPSPSTEGDDEQNPSKRKSINAGDSRFHSKEESLYGAVTYQIAN